MNECFQKGLRLKKIKKVAGAVGFEPTNAGSKSRCLTAVPYTHLTLPTKRIVLISDCAAGFIKKVLNSGHEVQILRIS